ncbi:AAA family ATPase [Gordonia sp. (in: high G+C Gram-positive bacteria)]|jgi:predicted ATP-binding protein involved in virulence|uniref:AAA family ATPase n=1 Tax=Gordonia sp. (in: high G+C Gram-positive bacteria) TaxID=84139 RepID=UPI001D7DC1F2|nr:AAA family ATPase [Gordonia sp. (in: high G+C Gram-positive bacteria)]MCB1296763.1 AAA family ATPase [Gordonia sp. (in: high G+C Gram-positive bacteria)]HMS74677.1 AAA family ATPase [Gordonia sp. (in: high G+C Gram-positive bacteria)]
MSTPPRWFVRRLELTNFRCFDELSIDFDSELTVLIGENGAGKTAVLDGLAVMLSTALSALGDSRRGFDISDIRLRPQGTSGQSVPSMEAIMPIGGQIHAVLAGEDYHWWRQKTSLKGRTGWGDKHLIDAHVGNIWDAANAEPPTTVLPVVASYGVDRLVGVRRAQGTLGRSRRDAYSAALDSKSDLTRLSSYIQGLTLDDFAATERGATDTPEARQLAAIRAACDRVFGHLGWRGPYWRQNVEELTMIHDDHGELPLRFLSSGLKIATGLTIDVASRMARANPALGGDDLLKSVPGIVLIDEIDLHLHPTWQQQIVPSMRRAFPHVQFITTTHSPQVLSTVPAKHIRVLGAEGVTGVNYSEGLQSDVVLQKVMGTPPMPDNIEISQTLYRYADLVAQGGGLSDDARRMRQILDERLGGASMVSLLADADATMAFYDLDDE